MAGQASHELEVEVAASHVWEIYGSLRLAQLVQQQLSNLLENFQVIQGDGGVGTVLKLTFVPVVPHRVAKEKFTKVDDEKRVKETEVIEGGPLELGFSEDPASSSPQLSTMSMKMLLPMPHSSPSSHLLTLLLLSKTLSSLPLLNNLN